MKNYFSSKGFDMISTSKSGWACLWDQKYLQKSATAPRDEFLLQNFFMDYSKILYEKMAVTVVPEFWHGMDRCQISLLVSSESINFYYPEIKKTYNSWWLQGVIEAN